MTPEELTIQEQARQYIKTHAKELIALYASDDLYHRVAEPITLFMAGSPGAGKTEVSKSFIKNFAVMPIRIDADEIRSFCPGYIGTNASLFQDAASKGVNILYDHAREKGINCIIDGTFSYAGAMENIERSLNRGRKIQIWYVYQDPIRAWEFTKAREIKETRHVSKETFIKGFMESRINVRKAKLQYGNKVQVNILIKDYEKNTEDIWLNVTVQELDQKAGQVYSEETLQKILP